MSLDPDLSGKWLAKVAKQLVREQVDNQKLSTLQQLKKQGHMSQCSPSDGANVWAKALDAAPDGTAQVCTKQRCRHAAPQCQPSPVEEASQ